MPEPTETAATETAESNATEYGTVEIYGAHALTEADVTALFPEGAIRDAALSAVRNAAGSRFAPLGPCSDCPECIEKARLEAEARAESEAQITALAAVTL